ncbi:Phytanoyl-CoA dioxygenase (PhyH) [Aquimarina amphilecti]|uniref:Phytanoyl-CoA dioxygenase (PhyH) n=1 Tax=Aquimarina amphilecti TaxID=1038014 RepID=A0A1H7UTE5_AQUAM|nr:phytanoyl-CoA dioxygenase family protein [Aquimarina amphilecti]SEL99918.1 Phytanoyl-CoA dioxygenase (PhyH) [Aquimarina amphilecti]
MYKTKLQKQGFATIPNIYSNQEINKLANALESLQTENENFRKTKDLFAIRKFLKEVPQLKDTILNNNLKQLVQEYFGKNYFLVKSIYFDKPPSSNWFVSYHQDLSISVNKKEMIPGYTNWTVKQQQFGVQPPLEILENIYTIRIHLDDTDKNNGALKVIPKSHTKGIYRPETIDWNIEKEVICNVLKGGVMLMKPLLLHSSNRTTNTQRRRVIHLEFSNKNLIEKLSWAEKAKI